MVIFGYTVMEFPPPTPTMAGLTQVVSLLTEKLPVGLQLDGVAYQDNGVKRCWSANYRVCGEFLPPSRENCQSAKAIFQRSVPAGAVVHQVLVLVISIGGTVIPKWQVAYGVASSE